MISADNFPYQNYFKNAVSVSKEMHIDLKITCFLHHTCWKYSFLYKCECFRLNTWKRSHKLEWYWSEIRIQCTKRNQNDRIYTSYTRFYLVNWTEKDEGWSDLSPDQIVRRSIRDQVMSNRLKDHNRRFTEQLIKVWFWEETVIWFDLFLAL